MNPQPDTIDTRRAITVQAPWAWAIICGLKTVENRTWPTRHRGRLYIHAGLKEDPDATAWMAGYIKRCAPGFADSAGWQLRGGIIGHIDVIGCDADNTNNEFETPGAYHWRLANAIAVPFERCAGALGIWRIGDRKRHIELPYGFTIKSTRSSGGFTATLYHGLDVIQAFTSLSRIEAQRAAAQAALRIDALPKLPIFGTDDCRLAQSGAEKPQTKESNS